MLIVGGTVTAADSTIRRGNFTEAWRPEVRPGLERRAQVIHEAAAVAVLQLVHLGRETLGAERYYAPVAPSAVRSPREPTAPRALSEPEIDEIVDGFRISAVHAVEAGFDGIELHAAHGYLLAQFLSPAANRRPSAQTLGGRAAPIWRIVDAIRDAGPQALIGIRLSVGDETDAGMSIEQLGELLGQLHPEIDYVNLTVGMRSTYVRDMATERPPLLDPLPRIRPLTDRPLVVSQSFRDAGAMEEALAAGADLVGMARALIADPDLPRKVLAGDARSVRPCVACNEDCRAFDPTLLCSVNPELAPPGEHRRPAAPLVLGPGLPSRPRRVGIVGAGPGGLECAVALAGAEGCEVVVWERERTIGGNIALAGAGPHRHGWLRLVDFYRAQLESSGVDLRLGHEVDASELQHFDTIVVASGAEEVPPVTGGAGSALTSSEAISAGPERLRGLSHVVVVDDGFGWWPSVTAVELAIAAGVEEVTLVTPGTAFATSIPAESRVQLLPRLRGIRLAIRALTSLAAVDEGAVELRGASSGTVDRLEADAVIVVGERRPRDWTALVADLEHAVVIGDAIVPRRAAHAIAEGRAAADLVTPSRGCGRGSPSRSRA